MEPTVLSQKKYTLTIIDPHKYRQAAAAHMGIAIARLFNRPDTIEEEPSLPDMSVDIPFEGRINDILDTGCFTEIFIDTYSNTVTHAIAAFRDYQRHPLPTLKVYFLIDFRDASTVKVAPGSHSVVDINYPLKTKGIGQFFL